MCWLNDTKLFFTGSRVAGLEDQVEYYDFEMKDMISTSKMNVGRSRHASVGFQEKYLYVFGGFKNDQHVEKIERFSLEGQNWTQINVQQGREFECIDASAVQISGD